MEHLEWVEARQKAQIEVDAPPVNKHAKRKTLEPKFKTMAEVLGLNVGQEDDIGEGAVTLSRDEIRARADELLRDPEARKAFFDERG